MIDANEHTHNTKFRFALEFVGIGFTANRGDNDPEPYIKEAFAMLVEAMEHATTAVHVLEEVFILPRFGI